MCVSTLGPSEAINYRHSVISVFLDTTTGPNGDANSESPAKFAFWIETEVKAMKQIIEWKRLISILAILATIGFGAINVKASDGDLDPTFSGDGKLTDGFLSSRPDPAYSVAIQTDGKIVVAGAGGFGFSVARYNTDGSLDNTFGTGGEVTSEDGIAYAVAIQTDGKIVVAGTQTGFAIIRYNPDGSIDTTFGNNGRVGTSFGDVYAEGRSVAIAADGKLVVSGYVFDHVTFAESFATARYYPDGSLDVTFDLDGKVTTPVGIPPPGQSGTASNARSVAIQSDGKIVVAGEAFMGVMNGFELTLVRYTANGSLDPSFSSDGVVTTNINNDAMSDGANDITIQSDGKIVAAGRSGNTFGLARYETDGTLDSSFGNGGTVTTQLSSLLSGANSVAIGTDGKIVAAGYSHNQNNLDCAVVRYNSNGSLDPFFGSRGIVITPIEGDSLYDQFYSVAIQPDGKVVSAGGSYASTGNWILARYGTDGTLDDAFDADGIVRTEILFYANPPLNDVAIQRDGKIVVGGAGGIVRYNVDGTRDTTFGGTGIIAGWANLAIQADGKIVSVRSYEDEYSIYYLELIRYNQDGSPDTSFGNDGTVTTIFGSYVVPQSLLIQPDGKFVIAASNFTLVRFNSTGSLDTTFGNGGIAEMPTGHYASASSAAIQSDGKIVLAGNSYSSDSGPDFAVARYNSNGSLDLSFDGDGIVTTDLNADDFGGDVAIQSDGKIVLGGCISPIFDEACDQFAIVRYNTNGSLDPRFDGDGKATTYIYGKSHNTVLSSVAIQPDGKIAASGFSYNGSNYDFALARFNPNGSLDNTFGGGDGKSTVDFEYTNDNAYGMALDRLGRAVVVGGSNRKFALARFLLAPRHAIADFDGDGRSDVSVFRPADRVWYFDRSTDGFSAVQFGLSTDNITPGDFDGDGATDIAVFRDGTWWRMNSSDHVVSAFQFGLPGDRPVPADYNGDGRDELAVYGSGQWWMLDLSNNEASRVDFGLATDKPVPADYDGDGRVDQAVYRNGEWHLNRSNLGYTVAVFGLPSDRTVVGDYDGDGKADLAVYRDETWYVQQSTAGFRALPWGISTDIPAPADYDGDGRTDIAVYRNGTWYILRSSNGSVSYQQFGLSTDIPISGVHQ
ncbi:MAG: hypothetical protein DMF63_11090 [Acidobacteria bacterium]|nr:MAG: hypothetical protein DMF63_11090 [Acidobacteriota bacterium]